MIIYFSGTGNSRYIAERIAEKLQDDLLNINERIKENDAQAINVNRNLIIVTPTYAWRIPRVVRDWIARTEFKGAEKAWFVMDCGGETGNAAKYNRQLCDEKGFVCMGTAKIIMPENYIALFGTPEPDAAKQIVAKAEPVIDEIITELAAGRAFSSPRSSLYGSIMSGPVNGLFYQLCIKAGPFCVSDECVSCGKCVNVCPLNNIALKDGKPVWGRNCTHFMACISYCPSKAIEYGKHSLHKARYTFESLK